MIVKSGQNLYDKTAEEFGTLEQLFTLLVDNDLGVTDKLTTGQKLIINKVGKGDEDIKSFISLRNLVFSNDQGTGNPPIEGGGFDNGFSNGFE